MGPSGDAMAQHALGMVARAAVLFALWLLLTDAHDEPDLITGGSAALLAGALATVLQAVRTEHARPRLVMLRYCYRPVLLLVTDTIRVIRALLRGLLRGQVAAGGLRVTSYRAVGEAPDEVARRAATEWAASLGPNRYVIGIDPERRMLIVHELVDAPGSLDPLELG